MKFEEWKEFEMARIEETCERCGDIGEDSKGNQTCRCGDSAIENEHIPSEHWQDVTEIEFNENTVATIAAKLADLESGSPTEQMITLIVRDWIRKVGVVYYADWFGILTPEEAEKLL